MTTTEPGLHAQRIAALVRNLLAKHDIHVEPALDADLRQAGLTSLDMVNLTLAVEGEFDVFIPAEQMTPEHFHSIATIQALVLGLAPA
jgi:acyl carrier protein